MFRRARMFAVLAAVALVLTASLSLALARPAPSSLLTPTIVPIFDQSAFMPRLLKDDAPSPTATATLTPTATATATSLPSATGTATSTPVAGRCVDYVYPITLGQAYLENNQPAWFKPVTLASIGLSPDADAAQIPSLNTTNQNSPRFRIYRDPNIVGTPANYMFVRWNGAEQQGSSQQLVAALTGAGTLGQGFHEFPPPASDPTALPLLNGALEPGDWLAGDSGNISAISEALNAHIATKTRMILPVYDRFTGTGGLPDSGYKVDRFVEVRLLNYVLTPVNTSYFEFALIQDTKTCGATPPTPVGSATATSTATAAPTATATATAAPTATATSTATAQPTATATSTATATATATTPVAGRCVDYVYPLTLHKVYLEQNLPAWYKPVTLASVGLSADAEDAQIPGLNSGYPFGTLNGANPNSPRFRIYRQPSTVGILGNYSFARWNGAESQGSAQQLAVAMTGAGSLGQGFSERLPPPEDSAAIALMNGVLEPGDWVAGNYGNVLTTDLSTALNAHIVNKTHMILPVHFLITSWGNSPEAAYKVDRFIEVRLLRYSLTPIETSYFELALIQDTKTCGPSPTPTPSTR